MVRSKQGLSVQARDLDFLRWVYESELGLVHRIAWLKRSVKAPVVPIVLNGLLKDHKCRARTVHAHLRDFGVQIAPLAQELRRRRFSPPGAVEVRDLDDFLCNLRLYKQGLVGLTEACRKGMTQERLGHAGRFLGVLAGAGQVPLVGCDRIRDYLKENERSLNLQEHPPNLPKLVLAEHT